MFLKTFLTIKNFNKKYTKFFSLFVIKNDKQKIKLCDGDNTIGKRKMYERDIWYIYIHILYTFESLVQVLKL